MHVDDDTKRIPGSERIIGLEAGSNGSIYIRTEFNLYKYKTDLITVPLITRDRILAVLDEEDKLWVVQARGTVQLFTLESDKYTYSRSFSLSEYSAVFYSASIICRNSVIEIVYGTIFSGILVAQINKDDNKIKSIGTLNGHRGTIFDIKNHPKDQNILVSCSDDRSIRIWKRATSDMFELSAVCNGHEARVWSIDVQKDIIASVSEDNNCRIWDLTGNCIKIIEGDSYSNSIWTVTINEAAEEVSFGSNDGSVITHNIKNNNDSKELVDYILPEYLGSIKNIVISKSGVLYAATDKCKLVKISNSTEITFVDLRGICKFPAMAINLKTLFIADEEGSLYSHELSSDEFKVETLLTLGTKKKISKIHAQDDSLLLETVNCEFYIYDLTNKSLRSLAIDRKHKVTSCSVIENRIYIGTRNGVLLVFDFYSLTLEKSVQLTQEESIKSIKRQNSDHISVLDRSGYEIILKSCDFTILSRNKIGKGILEGHIGKDLVTSFYQQYFIVNSPLSGVVNKVFCGGGHRIWSVASTSKDFYFAFMSNGKLTARHGSLETVKMVSSKSHGKEIRCAHNLDDNLVLSGSEDGLLILYDGLKVKSELRLTNTSIKCIASIEDFVFVGGSNETIEAFRLLNKKFLNQVATCPKQIKAIETRVLCLDAVKFEDDLFVLAGYSDASIRLFQYKDDSFILKATVEKVHQKRCVQQIRFLVDNNLKFISAGADGLIQAWIYREDKLEMLWNSCAHQSGINSIDLITNTDGFTVLTGGEDGSITLLTVKNDKIDKLETRNVHNSTVTGVKFIDSDSFISASIDRYIYVHVQDSKKPFRTVISDISAISLTTSNLFVYGAGIEAFNINFGK